MGDYIGDYYRGILRGILGVQTMGPYIPSGNPVSLYNPNVTPRSSLALDPSGVRV